MRTIEPEEIARKTGYSRAHTVHCGPDGIYVNALGSPEGDGPGGIFVLDHDTFEVKGAWERGRGSQDGNRYGHKLHVFDMRRRRHVQERDLGAEHQMALELRPAHDPDRAYGSSASSRRRSTCRRRCSSGGASPTAPSRPRR